jgi:hypothetical protein
MRGSSCRLRRRNRYQNESPAAKPLGSLLALKSGGLVDICASTEPSGSAAGMRSVTGRLKTSSKLPQNFIVSNKD